MYNDNSEVEIENEDSFNDESETATLGGNEAAAAFGGMAISLDINDIQLNLAETSSSNGIYQDSGDFDADADAEAETDDSSSGGAGAAAAAGINMNCTSLNAAYFW